MRANKLEYGEIGTVRNLEFMEREVQPVTQCTERGTASNLEYGEI